MNARLIVAASAQDANLLYATGFFAPDPFIFIEARGCRYIVLNDLELNRGRRTAAVDRVLSYNRYVKKIKRQGIDTPRISDVVRLVLKEFRIKSVEVPSNFPMGLAERLRGIHLRVKQVAFFPERAIKTASEVKKISQALRLTEQGIQAAMKALRACRIGRDGYLYGRGGKKTTAENIRGVINSTIAGLGGVATDTIVACGNQGCDPHEIGHGPLRANQTIVIDVFPRDVATGYFGDMTRTVVRGRATEAVRKIYATVAQAQTNAMAQLHAGVDGYDIHQGVNEVFKKNGYKTSRRNGRIQGFFHDTGHGLGLEIHEAPGLGGIHNKLCIGHVVTVEPGLYYWGVGGVRIEDVVLIGVNRARLLSNFPYVLEI